MRRKYDLRNKRNFVIILVIAIAVIGVFSLFIYRYMRSLKIEYKVDASSIIQDTNKNFINVDTDATLKIRWNGNYYLVYQDQNISLSKNVIVYNLLTEKIKLYGKFHEIEEDGTVVLNEEETALSNTSRAKFYKIDDREYLLVDKQITSNDRSIEASNYMLVELDKIGNAKLSNNKLNLKTINPTTLVTSSYSFDIANEILIYDKLRIDLKKIIGSTNQYTDDTEETKTSNGNGSGTTNNGVAWNNDVSSSNVVNNNGVVGQATTIEELKSKTKMTSIVRVQEGLSQIDIDYVIYDPYNEYKSVYAEIVKPGEVDVLHLSKTDTHAIFDKLNPNTEYTFNFVYTTMDEETGEVVRNTFDSMTLKTKMPKYSISVYKVSNVDSTLKYKVELQEGYTIDSLNVSLSFSYREVDSDTGLSVAKTAKIPSTINLSGGEKTAIGSISLKGYNIESGTLMTLSIDSVSSASLKLDINSRYTFRLGR